MKVFQDHPAEWHSNRRLAIGGSEAPIIMSGDADRIEQLRLEKLGRFTPKPFLSPWEIGLRRITEGLQLDWYEFKSGHPVTYRGQHLTASDYPFMAAELDGYDPIRHMTIDCKHLDGWLKEPLEWAKEKYSWQIVHQMIVANAEVGALSILHGVKEPQYIEWEFDPFAADELIARCAWFWEHVTGDKPIGGSVVKATEIPAPKAAPSRVVDMTGDNEFADWAATWIATKDAANKFTKAEKDLKAKVEADVVKAHGHGIEITRNKGGALSIKLEETRK